MEASSMNGFMNYATDLTILSGSAFTVCQDKNDLNTIRKSLGPRRDKTCLLGVANNAGAYQTARMRRLI